MARGKAKTDIPSDRKCCLNCRFATISITETHIKNCEKKKSRFFMARTYKCKDFYNKEWPVQKEERVNADD